MVFDINFERKLFCIFGLNESGKSFLAKFISQNYRTAVFDVLGEYDRQTSDVYIPVNKQYPNIVGEYDKFIQFIRDKPYNLVITDEANRVLPNMKPLPNSFRTFLDSDFRHGVHPKGLGFICRRPAQLNTDLVELSHYIILFNLKGKNDIAYFNCLNSAIGDLPARLEPHSFMIIMPDRSFKIFNPIR